MELLPWTELSLKNVRASWFSLAEFDVLYRKEISKKRTGLFISRNKTQKEILEFMGLFRLEGSIRFPPH